jgi:rod shape-determining protein MreD
MLTAIFQSTVMPLITIGGAKPDLTLLIVISWSLLRGTGEGIIWGFVGGLCVDVLSGGPLGASAIGMMTVSLMSGQGKTNLFKGNLMLPLLLAPVGTIVYYGLVLVVLELTGRSTPVLTTLTQAILPAAVVNLIAMPFVYAFMRWLDRKTERQQISW